MQNFEYDISMREDDFALYVNGEPLCTPLGNMIVHSNARLIRQIVMEEMMGKGSEVSLKQLLAKQIDVDDAGKFGKEILLQTQIDPFINQDADLSNINFDKVPNLLNCVFMNAATVASAISMFKLKDEQSSKVDDKLNHMVEKSVMCLTFSQKIALQFFTNELQNGVLIHLLLIKNLISVSEYASVIVMQKLKAGEFDADYDLILQHSNAIKEKSQIIIDFLSLSASTYQSTVIEEIINRGEDDQTEFKSTLRWDIRQNKKNPAIEHAALKTVCAFLNSEGGNLLIGVRDDGSIEGVETDVLVNDDKFLLHLWTLIKTCMGQEVVEFVKTSMQKFGDKTVCRVACNKSAKPVFLRQKGFDEAFYVRIGPSSGSLDISSALKYIEQHFSENSATEMSKPSQK